MKTSVKRPSFMPPTGANAKEYRERVAAETGAALAEGNQPGETVSHNTVRRNILKRRLARVPTKAAA